MTTAKIISGLRRRFEIEQPIYYCLVSSPRIQACAFLLQGGFRCIAIWMGALIINRGSLLRLAVMPTLASFFSVVARPELALGPFPGLNTIEAFQKLTEPAPVRAVSEHERMVVEVFFTRLVSFITLHEAAHAINGHLFLPGLPSAQTIIETGDAPSSEDGRITAQTLEWDADAFAAIRAIGAALASESRLERAYHFDGLADRLGWRLMNAMIPMYFACRLFERRPFSVEHALSENHPPGAIRFLMMLPQAQQAWLQLPLTKEFPFPAASVAQAIHLCEGAIAELTGVAAPEFTLLTSLPIKWSDWYQGLIAERWSVLQPELLKYKVGNHELAPADEVIDVDFEDILGAASA